MNMYSFDRYDRHNELKLKLALIFAIISFGVAAAAIISIFV